MKPVLVFLDLDAGRWARYEGKVRTLRGVVIGDNPRSHEWLETLAVIRETGAVEPQSA